MKSWEGKHVMKVTVCQIEASRLEQEWDNLVHHVGAHRSRVVLLPEMPFSTWFCASRDYDADIWDNAVKQHEMWSQRLPELGADVIAGSMPINHQGKRLNAGFIWSAHTGLQVVHEKTYVPDEPGFWEASWYHRGKTEFQAVSVGDLRMGFMICTEMWFFQHAREYGKQDIHLLLCPRSTLSRTVEKWTIGGQAAAVVSGSFCLSSNHCGRSHDTELGGAGWIVDPYGVLLGTTSQKQPFLSLDLDLTQAEAAKQDYPCYVIDTPV